MPHLVGIIKPIIRSKLKSKKHATATAAAVEVLVQSRSQQQSYTHRKRSLQKRSLVKFLDPLNKRSDNELMQNVFIHKGVAHSKRCEIKIKILLIEIDDFFLACKSVV